MGGGISGSTFDPTSRNFGGGGTLGSAARFTNVLNPGFAGGGMTGRVLGDLGTMGLAEFKQSNPFGIPGNPLASVFGNGSQSGAGVSGPFTLDPAQFTADRAAISGEGQKQFNDTNAFINSDATARSAARDQLANVLNTQAKNSFSQMLPDIAENSQAAHLYDSTGYGQEVARQQAALESGIQSQLGQQGVQDIYNTSNQRAAALQGQQGFGSAALQRGLSLEDQINNANISKSIGAAFAPQPPSGKSQFGTTAQGIGALAPLAKLGKTAAVA